MKLQNALRLAAATVLTLSPTTSAFAHVGTSDKGNAGKSQVISFGVGHGCDAASDTLSIEISIPAEVTTLRGVPSADFGAPVLTRNEANLVTKVTFTKTRLSPLDEQYYTLQVRITVPNTPFETLVFPIIQRCKNADGVDSMTAWVDTGPDSEYPPARLPILPARSAGWNKFTVPVAITDLAIFSDAEIVWSGDSAYSANPTTAELIAGESGVTPLESIEANSEIWVKY
jgi:hypothetical protein